MTTHGILSALLVSALGLGAAQTGEAFLGEPGGDPLATAGSYDGFFYSSRAYDDAAAPALRGTLSVKVTDVARGKLTAHALLQSGPLNFNGTAWDSADTNGTRRVSLTGRGTTKATLTLFMTEQRMWGSLEGEKLGEALTLEGARNVFAERATNIAARAQSTLGAFRGYYTVALPTASALSLGAADAAPQGVGYLTLTVGNGGSVKVAGQLADGTGVALSSRLILFSDATSTNAAGATNTTETVTAEKVCVPVFTSLYAKRGWFGALLWLQPGETSTTVVATDRDLGWYARWENPGSHSQGKSNNGKSGENGFQMLLDVCGGYYSAVSAVASNYLFSAAEPDGVRYYSGNSVGDYVAEAMPSGIVVTVSAGMLKMAPGANPPLMGGAYDYSVTNAAQATIVGALRTGLFKGMFNLYYDYERNGNLMHKKERVSYAGVLAPVRGEGFADLPVGMGFYRVQDTSPAFRSYSLKRSFPVVLEAAP